MAQYLVFKTIHKKLGLQEAKVLLVGAAPVLPGVLQFFASLDLPVFEVYGQSESSGPHTLNCPAAWKIGSCGRPMKGTQSKLVTMMMIIRN